MSKHTAWTLRIHPQVPILRECKSPHGEAPTYHSTLREIGDPPYRVICRLDFGYGTPDDEAHAHLIAAAPRLLEALKAILKAWHDDGCWDGDNPPPRREYRLQGSIFDALSQADDAIREAEAVIRRTKNLGRIGTRKKAKPNEINT